MKYLSLLNLKLSFLISCQSNNLSDINKGDEEVIILSYLNIENGNRD